MLHGNFLQFHKNAYMSTKTNCEHRKATINVEICKIDWKNTFIQAFLKNITSKHMESDDKALQYDKQERGIQLTPSKN